MRLKLVIGFIEKKLYMRDVITAQKGLMKCTVTQKVSHWPPF